VHGIGSEEHNSLKYIMKCGICKTSKLTCLDQVDKRSSIHIPLRERECQIKGCPRVIDKLLSTECDTLGNVTRQRCLDLDNVEGP
jgi:hypothetical protein